MTRLIPLQPRSAFDELGFAAAVAELEEYDREHYQLVRNLLAMEQDHRHGAGS